MPEVGTRVKPRKLVYHVWKTPQSETTSETRELAQPCPTDSCTDNCWRDDGWSYDEGDDDWSSVGWHEGWDQMCDNSASSLSLGSFDLGAMSSPNRFEWSEHELGHRSCSEHIYIELRFFRWSRKWKIRSNSQWVSAWSLAVSRLR